MDEARETLHRIRDVRVEYRDHGAEYWQRPAKATPEMGVSDSHLTDAETLRWQNYIDGKISAAIAARDEFWRDVFGAVIAEERKKMRAEVQERIGLLRADLTIEKAAERGDVVELPALPLRNRRA